MPTNKHEEAAHDVRERLQLLSELIEERVSTSAVIGRDPGAVLLRDLSEACSELASQVVPHVAGRGSGRNKGKGHENGNRA